LRYSKQNNGQALSKTRSRNGKPESQIKSDQSNFVFKRAK